MMKSRWKAASLVLGGALLGAILALTFLSGMRAKAQTGTVPQYGEGVLRLTPFIRTFQVTNVVANRVPTTTGAFRNVWQADTADGKATFYWEEGGDIHVIPRIR